MGINNYFLIKCFILFWMVCAVLCAHKRNHHKRDVHRIILKERPPRSHKNHGHHGHSHSRKKGNKNKGKRDSDESVSASFENSASYSIENNSFEEGFRGHKSHTKQSHKNPLFSRHRFPSNLDIEETRQHQFRDDFTPFYNSGWIPLNSDHHHSPSEHHHSFTKDFYREKDRRNNRKTKKHSQKTHNNNKPYGIDFTTSLPPVSFDSSTLYPPIDVISSFTALNQKLLQTNPSILSKFEKSTLKDSSEKLKNHQTSYDVTEGQGSELEEYIYLPDKPNFSHSDFGSTGKYDAESFERHNSRNKGNKDKYRGKTKF